MRHQHIAICVPSLGLVSVVWAGAYSSLLGPLNTGIVKIFVCGKGVAEARNECVKQALDIDTKHPCVRISHIFWIDDDVVLQAGALVTLLKHKKQIVSGVYFTKSAAEEPLIFDAPFSGTAPFVPGEFREVWAHGMGLTLVELDVYKRMQKELDLGVDQYDIPAWYRAGTPVGEDPQARFGSEDLHFLSVAHDLGIPAYIDASKECFGWHHDPTLRRGYPFKQWTEWQQTGKVTWETPDGPVVWTELHC